MSVQHFLRSVGGLRLIHIHAPAIIDEFALRYVRFYPGVLNIRAELVTLAPRPCFGDYG